MNPVTLNDNLKPAVYRLIKDKKLQREILLSPYLTLDRFDPHPVSFEDAAMIDMINQDDLLTRTPYPVFRFYFQTDISALYGFVVRKSELLQLFCFQQNNKVTTPICWFAEYRSGTNAFQNKLNCDLKVFKSNSFVDVSQNLRDVLVEAEKDKKLKAQGIDIDGKKKNWLKDKYPLMADAHDY